MAEKKNHTKKSVSVRASLEGKGKSTTFTHYCWKSKIKWNRPHSNLTLALKEKAQNYLSVSLSASLEGKRKSATFTHYCWKSKIKWNRPHSNLTLALKEKAQNYLSVSLSASLEGKRKSATFTHCAFSFCSEDTTRTCDLRVMSPTSYQLLHLALYSLNQSMVECGAKIRIFWPKTIAKSIKHTKNDKKPAPEALRK